MGKEGRVLACDRFGAELSTVPLGEVAIHDGDRLRARTRRIHSEPCGSACLTERAAPDRADWVRSARIWRAVVRLVARLGQSGLELPAGWGCLVR